MRKRLRKKKHIGEFVEWGAAVEIVRTQKAGFDAFLDEFLDEAIEGNGCYFGGGGKEDRLGGMIELGRSADGPEEKLRGVRGWLDTREDVQEYVTGSIADNYNGPFSEVDAIEDGV